MVCQFFVVVEQIMFTIMIYGMSVFCCCLTNKVHDIWYVNENDVAL